MNYFEKNMEVLREHRPQLADSLLSDGTDEASVRVTTSKNNAPGVIFTKVMGKRFALTEQKTR